MPRSRDGSESGDEGTLVDDYNHVDRETTSTPSSAGISAEHDDAMQQTERNERVTGLTHALSGLQINSPSPSRTRTRLTSTSRLRNLILPEPCPLLFCGESPTRALPLAIGAMRGSLGNMKATNYYANESEKKSCPWRTDKSPAPETISGEMLKRFEQNNSEDRDKLQSQSPGACVVSSCPTNPDFFLFVLGPCTLHSHPSHRTENQRQIRKVR